MKIILESKSQGSRGDWGYKKRYALDLFEVSSGKSVVEISWGRAELWYSRQRKQHTFDDSFLASLFIDEQVEKKVKKGYEIVATNP
jgi:predicted DNA-binding WGR domain protein